MIPVPKPMTILLPSHICQVVAMISSMTPCYRSGGRQLLRTDARRQATHDVDEEEDQVKRGPSAEAVRELAAEHESEDLEGGEQRRPTVMHV